jgi:hypothetical protein
LVYWWYLFYSNIIEKAKHLLTDEMLLIISLALCLMMVIWHLMGFSPALGVIMDLLSLKRPSRAY